MKTKKEKVVIFLLTLLMIFCFYMALTVEEERDDGTPFPSYVPGEVIEPTPPPTVADKVREVIGRSTPTPTPKPIDEDPIVIGDTLIDSINAIRKSQGKRQLIVEPKLMAGANKRAMDLQTSGQWSHDNYAQAFIEAGVAHNAIGENLARDVKNDTNILRKWLASPSHANLMLNPVYRYVGVGRYKNYVVFWASATNY